VTEVVIDASIAIRWLEPSGTPGGAPAQSLLDEYEAGRLSVVVPPLLFLEILNVAGRRWHWAEARLVELTTRLVGMFEDVVPPDLGRVAVWTGRGLSAYDASYVALAEERDRALAALKELEFDHRTGKVSDEDYRAQVGPLRRRAAEVLRALDQGEQAAHERVPDQGQRVS